MRILPLIAAAAFALVSVTAHAGEGRSLSLNGVDQKLPGALGKAAVAPKVVEAPKPPDPPRPPDPPKAAEAQPAAAPAPAEKAEPPAFVQRPSAVGAKPAEAKEGQVTFNESKPAPAAPATTTGEKSKQAKSEKPRRKRVHWDEARIMREVYRYGGYAGMLGGW